MDYGDIISMLIFIPKTSPVFKLVSKPSAPADKLLAKALGVILLREL